MGKFQLFLAAAAVATFSHAAEWRNVDRDHHLGGRMASAGYLQGKVVLVCKWSANEGGGAMMSRLEEVWRGFKTKQFVVLGGHVGTVGDEARKIAAGVTFPVYREAGISTNEPVSAELPFLYVVDETGRLVYLGLNDRSATRAVVTALTDAEAPKNLAQWKRFLDYELDHLPCRAFLRMKDFAKQYPKEAKAYKDRVTKLAAVPDVRKVADLVEFAKRAKDPPRFGPKETVKRRRYEKLVKDVIDKCEPMKNAADPRVAQEAKNALADLKWTQAEF
ncbi:MAG: hypothetical protein J6T01_05625 [Kiritimatiellae bacterium]|nr:hypothetical protein [Kiritimatiellia bacterium]